MNIVLYTICQSFLVNTNKLGSFWLLAWKVDACRQQSTFKVLLYLMPSGGCEKWSIGGCLLVAYVIMTSKVQFR